LLAQTMFCNVNNSLELFIYPLSIVSLLSFKMKSILFNIPVPFTSRET
jgi:hypothetical protein